MPEKGAPPNSGPLWQQWSMVQRTIARLAFPGGKPRAKPGAYRGETVLTKGERDLEEAAARARAHGGSGR